MRETRALALLGLFVIPVFVAAASLSCRKREAGWRGSVERRDGIVYVKNPGRPIRDGEILQLEKDLSIGRAEGPDEYLFTDIRGIDVDAEGNIYILDLAEANVRIFDPDGRYMRTIGRKGQGPGEMESPVFVHITARGEVFVYDLTTFRAIFFSRDGEFLRQKTVGRGLLPMRLDSREWLIGWEFLAPPPIGGKVLILYPPEGPQSVVLARDEQGQRGVFDIGKPTIHGCVAPNDQIVWGNSETYVFHMTDPIGKTIRTIQKDYEPVPITSADRRENEERYAEPVRHGMRLSFRDNFPAYSAILADEEGRIFVKTYERAEGEGGRFMFDVFDPEGRYLAKVTVRANLNERSVWKMGKLYTVEEDEEGYSCLVRHTIKWLI